MTAANRTLLICSPLRPRSPPSGSPRSRRSARRRTSWASRSRPLQADVDQQEQAIADGQQARHSFPGDYQQLVLLGKAVPAGDEPPLFWCSSNRMANDAGVEFRAASRSRRVGCGRRGAGTAPARAGAPPADPRPPARRRRPAPATESARRHCCRSAPRSGPAGSARHALRAAVPRQLLPDRRFIDGLDPPVEDRQRPRRGRRPAGHDRRVRAGQDEAAASRRCRRSLLVTTYVTPPARG